MAKPLSDLTIEVRSIGAVKDIPVKKLPCRVHQLERVADDVMIVHLKLPANERLQFLAGQYIEQPPCTVAQYLGTGGSCFGFRSSLANWSTRVTGLTP